MGCWVGISLCYTEDKRGGMNENRKVNFMVKKTDSKRRQANR